MIEAAMIWNEPNNKSHWDPEVDPDWTKFGAMAIAAAAFTGETPSFSSVGVTIAPDVRTAAEDDPVIIPGSIRSPVIPIVRRKGKVRNLRIIQAAADSIRPICCTVFINIIALKMIRMVSR